MSNWARELDELLAECGVKPWIKSPQQQTRENELIKHIKQLQTELADAKRILKKVCTQQTQSNQMLKVCCSTCHSHYAAASNWSFLEGGPCPFCEASEFLEE